MLASGFLVSRLFLNLIFRLGFTWYDKILLISQMENLILLFMLDDSLLD